MWLWASHNGTGRHHQPAWYMMKSLSWRRRFSHFNVPHKGSCRPVIFQPQRQLLIKAPSPFVVPNKMLDIGVNAEFEDFLAKKTSNVFKWLKLWGRNLTKCRCSDPQTNTKQTASHALISNYHMIVESKSQSSTACIVDCIHTDGAASCVLTLLPG